MQIDMRRVTMPSVTEVLQPWTKWDKVPQDVLEAAAERGSRVHELITTTVEAEMFGFETPRLNLDDEHLWGYFESWDQWHYDYVTKVISVEKRYYELDLGYHGRPDMIVVMRGDNDTELAVVDIKTSKNKHHTWPYQLAAYAHLVEHTLSEAKVIKTLSVRVREDQRLPFVDVYSREEWLKSFAVFTAALTAYKYLMK